MTVISVVIFAMFFTLIASESCPADDDHKEHRSGACFKFQKADSRTTAKQAKQYCESLGPRWSLFKSHHDKELQAFITTQLANRNWPHAIIDGQRKLYPWSWVKQNGSIDANQILRYQGCYADGGSTGARDLDGTSFFIDDNTPKTCIEKCASLQYKYAGVQQKSFCYCGDRYGKYPAKSDCHQQCPGDPLMTCGNTGRNEVYLVDMRSYSHWFTGSPNGNGNCAAIDPTVNYQWVDEICGREYAFYCEAQDGPICAEGTCFHYVGERQNWYAAQKMCEEGQMRLAKVDSPAKMKVLEVHLSGIDSAGSAWIGATNSRWFTADAKLIKEMPWEYDHPKDRFQHNCMKLTRSNEWNSVNCEGNEEETQEVFFVCEKGKLQSTTPMPSTIQNGPKTTGKDGETTNKFSTKPGIDGFSTKSRPTTGTAGETTTLSPASRDETQTTTSSHHSSFQSSDSGKTDPNKASVTKFESEFPPTETSKLPYGHTTTIEGGASSSPDMKTTKAFSDGASEGLGSTPEISNRNAFTTERPAQTTSDPQEQSTPDILSQTTYPVPVNKSFCDPPCEEGMLCYEQEGNFSCSIPPDSKKQYDDDTAPSSGESSAGLFVGIAIAIVVVLIIIVIIVFLVQKSNKDNKVHPDRKPRKPAGKAYAPDPDGDIENHHNGV